MIVDWVLVKAEIVHEYEAATVYVADDARIGVPKAVAVVVAVACGQAPVTGVPEEAFPVVANADLAVGKQRLLVGLVTADGASYAAPDRSVEFDLYPPEAVEPSFSVAGIFIWTVPEIRGLYTHANGCDHLTAASAATSRATDEGSGHGYTLASVLACHDVDNR